MTYEGFLTPPKRRGFLTASLPLARAPLRIPSILTLPLTLAWPGLELELLLNVSNVSGKRCVTTREEGE